MDRELFEKNSAYTRSALAAASAVFKDADFRKKEYLYRIVKDSLERGRKNQTIESHAGFYGENPVIDYKYYFKRNILKQRKEVKKMTGWSEKLNQVTQSVNQVTQSAISKGREVAGVTKLNVEIGTLNQSIKSVYTEVGKYVVENGLLSEDESVAEWTAKVADLKAEIDENNEKIHNLKSGNYCPNCGAKLPKASKFCNYCGSAMVVRDSGTEEEDQEIIDADYSEATGDMAEKEAAEGTTERTAAEGTAEKMAAAESAAERTAAEGTAEKTAAAESAAERTATESTSENTAAADSAAEEDRSGQD